MPEHELDPQEGTLLEHVAESRTVRSYVGTLLVVNFDGGYSEDLGTGGFVVIGRDGVLAARGLYDLGSTNNHAEVLAALEALKYVVDKRFYRGYDYTELRGDSQLVLNYLQRVWRPK